MYCSSCGIDSVEGLKYCKRCGVNLTAPSEFTPPKKLPALLTALFLLVIGGIAALGLGLPLEEARHLVSLGFTPKHVMILFVCSAGVSIVISGLLSQVLLRLIETSQTGGGARAVSERQTAPIEAQQISAQPSSIGSVTEHTTRSFEPHRFGDAQR